MISRPYLLMRTIALTCCALLCACSPGSVFTPQAATPTVVLSTSVFPTSDTMSAFTATPAPTIVPATPVPTEQQAHMVDLCFDTSELHQASDIGLGHYLIGRRISSTEAPGVSLMDPLSGADDPLEAAQGARTVGVSSDGERLMALHFEGDSQILVFIDIPSDQIINRLPLAVNAATQRWISPNHVVLWESLSGIPDALPVAVVDVETLNRRTIDWTARSVFQGLVWISPSGNQRVYIDQRSNGRKWVYEAVDHPAIVLAPADGSYALAWSPDGRYFAMYSHDLFVYDTHDLATPQELDLSDMAGGSYQLENMAWSPSGRSLAMGMVSLNESSDAGGALTYLAFLDFNTNTVDRYCPIRGVRSSLVWSPDSRSLMWYAATPDDQHVYSHLFDVASGREAALTDFSAFAFGPTLGP